MRKYILVLMVTMLLLDATCQRDLNVTSVEFTSVARGFQKRITITRDSVITTSGRNSNPIPRVLDKSEWKKLMRCVNEITPEELPELKSPAMKRAYDGARHSTIMIATKEQSWSHSFDDEDPHAKLKPLLNLIKSIGEIEKK